MTPNAVGAAGSCAVRLRAARSDDGAALSDVHARAIRAHCTGHYTPDEIEAWCARTSEASFAKLLTDRRIVVAESIASGRVVGFGQLLPVEGVMEAVYVDPDCSHCGIGTAIVRELERVARKLGLPGLVLDASTNSVGFYAAFGFKHECVSRHALASGVSIACTVMSKRLDTHRRERGRASGTLLALLGIAALLAAVEFYVVSTHRPAPPPIASAQTAAPSVAAKGVEALPTETIGWVDTPAEEVIEGTLATIRGWALDRTGVSRVEVRLDGAPFAARYGLPRPDVAAVKPGYPNGANSGFEFERDFADVAAIRHEIAVVAIANDGRETVLARRSLVPRAAVRRASAFLDDAPALAASPFTFLMMTSGVSAGGADELDTQYRGYGSRTQRVGMAVPILYLRTTRGAADDWQFDAAFDLTRKCGGRAVADDNLAGVIRHATAKRLPVQFILNGGIWADASCDTPQWDLNDHLEQDTANCQWTAENEVFPDDYLKNLPGSTNSPQLGRTLTYNVYASTVRQYKRRNLQAAARTIAQFAREHPDLFVGVALDADSYMNPFFMQKGVFKIFDYNPGMLKQFRHWLRGDGPYAGKAEPGVPNLAAYRRPHPLTLADVNRIAGKQWTSWEQVDPPRRFPGAPGAQPVIAGQPVIFDDPWYQEWQVFRQHVIDLHYDELSQWAHEAGIAKERIFTAQGFIAPDPGTKPFAIRVTSRGQNYDTSGVSVEGAIPRFGHLGVIIYGEAARNDVRMEQPHSLFATFARMDPGWAVVEYNSTDLKHPLVQPDYGQAYRSFRDMFNYGASEISAMAWNGSNGIFAGQPDYLPYTAWRNTPAEDAMRDFLVAHADLPRGAQLWTFGTARRADDDGWSAEQGSREAHRGYLALAPADGSVMLRSPDDLVVRPRTIDRIVLDFGSGPKPLRATVYARADSTAQWQTVGVASDASRIALDWPAAWKSRDTIVVQLKISLGFTADVRSTRLERVLLYPVDSQRVR